MATVTQCYTPIKAKVLRVTALDECGVPLCGDDPDQGQVVLSAMTQVVQSAQYDEGEEHTLRTADSDMCVNEKDPDALKRVDVSITICAIDPGLVVKTLLGARLLTTAGIGTGFGLAEGIDRKHWSLEVWQRVSGQQACDPDGNQQWVYNAWPHINNGKLGGDYTIAAAPSTLQITGMTKAVNELWWLGDDWLGDDPVSPLPDHWLHNVTTVEPPTADCGIADVACVS